MSLLDGGTQTVTVYPQVLGVDDDGNPRFKASPTGVTCRASVQPRADEGEGDGQATSAKYRLRLERGAGVELGPHAEVVWRNERWAVVGEPRRHSGSPRTSRTVATIERR
ncbi:hypothetical protein [Actinomycetospora sp. CA-053990]|uniref:hypothetical protein n=1 Tax=Actinomycetospora sp. CA-053990 TaxID=3239891 RepID=UPI003D911B65